MTKLSDNLTPSLLLVEQDDTAVVAPAAGNQRLFIDEADGLLYLKDSADDVAAVGAAGVSGSPSGIQFVIDGGGAEIAAGVAGFVQVPFACTITAARLLADQSGSIAVDIWKDTYANYPPTDADTITSGTPPTITTATKSEDTTLTSWTTAIAAGDVLGFNVDSCTTIERVTVVLSVTRT